LSNDWRETVVASLIVAAVGFVLMLSAFFVRPRTKPPARRTAAKT
jgi:hypothetical protein